MPFGTGREPMATAKNRLSDREVRTALSRKMPGMSNDGGGLYLRIRDSGRGEWVFRYSLNGRDRWMPLAAADDLPLEAARKKARALRVAVDDNRDPIVRAPRGGKQGTGARHVSGIGGTMVRHRSRAAPEAS